MQVLEHPLVGPVIRLAHGADEALVALLGGHVVAWRRHGRDMLWCAKNRLEGRPLRGGIPVCWPWFATHPTDPLKPFHGVARLRPWQVAEQHSDRVSMVLTEGSLVASIDITLADELRISLTTRNEGAADVTISAALHTYLAISDIGDIRVTGLDGAGYLDKVDQSARKVQRGDLLFDREVDRIYAVDRATLHDGARRIEVDGAGTSRSLVVWNAWAERSAQVPDLGPDTYRGYVCLETAWAADDARTMAPGAAATLTTVLRPAATYR